MKMLRRVDPWSTLFAAAAALAYLVHPQTNPDLLLWRWDTWDGSLRGAITYGFSHATWLHLAVNCVAMLLCGHLLSRRYPGASAACLVVGTAGGAIAFHAAVMMGRAGLALQGASAAALALAACVAVCCPLPARLLGVTTVVIALWPLDFGGTWFAHFGGICGGLLVGIEARARARDRATIQQLNRQKLQINSKPNRRLSRGGNYRKVNS